MKIILKKLNDIYIIEKCNYGNGEFDIEGTRYKDLKEGIFIRKPKSIKYIEVKSRVVKYGNLLPDEYEKQRNALIKEKDENNYPVFSNLDDEYMYKKFIQEHPAEYEKYEDIQKCEIVEYNIQGNLSNPFIIPYRLLGEEPIKNNQIIYRYDPNPFKMACEITKKLGLQQVERDETLYGGNTQGMKWSVPEHSIQTLEFTKVDTRYASYKKLPKFYGIKHGTYDECLKQYKEHYNAIKEMFEEQVIITQAKSETFDKAKVLVSLKSIIDLVSKIECKLQSDINPKQVVNAINELIKSLT